MRRPLSAVEENGASDLLTRGTPGRPGYSCLNDQLFVGYRLESQGCYGWIMS